MNKELELKATTRQVLGKKVRFLRRQGITPAHLFGHNVPSVALQSETRHIQQVLARAGKTRLINLSLDDATPRKVIAREVQRDPVTGVLLHVDLYQVSMAEKIKMEVPIVLVGEAPALADKDNILNQELDTLEVECLPDRIPQSIEVDVSSLTEADQAIRVRDIKPGEGITILNNPDVVLVRASTRPEIKEEEVAAPPEAAAAPAPEEQPKEEAGEA